MSDSHLADEGRERGNACLERVDLTRLVLEGFPHPLERVAQLGEVDLAVSILVKLIEPG